MDVRDTSLRCLNDIPNRTWRNVASDMKQFGFGRLNVNNYTSPSAESEGRNDFIVFKPQLHGRGGLDGTRVSAGCAKSYNARIRNALASATVGVLSGCWAGYSPSTNL